MTLNSNIRVIQSLELLVFLVFSYLPFISIVIIEVPRSVSQNALNITIIGVFLATLIGIITIYGILTLKLSVRIIGSIFFCIGIVLGSTDVYTLAFGVVLSWVFYEVWYLSSHYHQLDQEYTSYHEESVERKKLMDIFQTQIFSLLFLAWIVLSLSWGILFISSSFFVQIGRDKGFGTLGITLSVSLLALLVLVRKFILSSSR
jgi:hypothetical protein